MSNNNVNFNKPLQGIALTPPPQNKCLWNACSTVVGALSWALSWALSLTIMSHRRTLAHTSWLKDTLTLWSTSQVLWGLVRVLVKFLVKVASNYNWLSYACFFSESDALYSSLLRLPRILRSISVLPQNIFIRGYLTLKYFLLTWQHNYIPLYCYHVRWSLMWMFELHFISVIYVRDLESNLRDKLGWAGQGRGEAESSWQEPGGKCVTSVTPSLCLCEIWP